MCFFPFVFLLSICVSPFILSLYISIYTCGCSCSCVACVRDKSKRKEYQQGIVDSLLDMALKDTFYISHGSPTLSIDESILARKFLQSWKKDVFPQRPSSILVISGHWETAVPTVNVVDSINDTIYDFYGFPKQMYQVSLSTSKFRLLLLTLFSILVFVRNEDLSYCYLILFKLKTFFTKYIVFSVCGFQLCARFYSFLETVKF